MESSKHRIEEGKSEDIRIDFLEEFAKKNLQLVIDEILKTLSPVSIIRASKVSQTWKNAIVNSRHFPHALESALSTYQDLNPCNVPDPFENKVSAKLKHYTFFPYIYNVFALLVDEKENSKSMFVGLVNGSILEFDLSETQHKDNLVALRTLHPREKDQNLGQMSKNNDYLACFYGNHNGIVIYDLKTASVINEILTDDTFDFIEKFNLTPWNSAPRRRRSVRL